MNVILVAVVSLDGKLTRSMGSGSSTNIDDPDIYKWTSREDQDFFFGKIKNAKLIVMGSGTYEAVRDNLNFEKKDRLRIVLTKNTEKYKDQEMPGVLEFRNQSLIDLYDSMIDHTEMLVVGGAKVYSSFMKEGLVDEIYLTMEPVIFGRGKPLFGEEFVANLKLVSMKKLNSNGTLLFRYIVKR